MSEKNKGLKKVSVIMEKFWLALAIISLLVVFYIFIVDGVNQKTLTYLVFPALAALMYAFRRTFRKRLEKTENEQ